MTNEREWFTSAAGRRVTATDISEYLGISRRTATNRLNDGLSADDIIVVARKLGVSPVDALVELGQLSYDEVFSFLDQDGTLLASASPAQLVRQLAEDTLPLSDRIELGAAAKAKADRRDELAERRAKKSQGSPQGFGGEQELSDESTPDVQDGGYDPLRHVAYGGEDEDQLRRQQEGDWEDPDHPIP
ncbi:hypothetical protein [Corynebacterium sp. CNJ-954]|uniref:hypothetical protein n=1 Tax=Corynebacterium sp. CNJ-954 TaxID=1904962 RepID=UPI0013016763|nr:hypothetical protein [Corynebacterium sp. CNJ-954]